jgi:hypothetical protein
VTVAESTTTDTTQVLLLLELTNPHSKCHGKRNPNDQEKQEEQHPYHCNIPKKSKYKKTEVESKPAHHVLSAKSIGRN